MTSRVRAWTANRRRAPNVASCMILAATSTYEAVFGRLLLSLAVVIAVARLAGALSKRLGQPAVIGEILAGIALGPSLLGLVRADLPGRLFPADVVPLLKVVSEIGLVLFMFGVGLEVDAKAMRASGRQAVVISLTSIALPFALGVAALAPLLHGAHDVVGGSMVRFLPFALFIGVSMCGTAFAVLARILTEHDLLATRLGTLLMACAAIDDVVAFCMLGVVVAIAASASSVGVLVTLAELIALIVTLFAAVGRCCGGRCCARTSARACWPPSTSPCCCSVCSCAPRSPSRSGCIR